MTAAPPGQLAGATPREGGDVDNIQDELRKLGSLTEGPDWDRVVAISTVLLAGNAKDLRVACWCCVGLFVTRGCPGLADGLGSLRRLVENSWAEMFPPLSRISARRRALEWLGERALALLEQRTTSAAEADALRQVAENARALGDLLGQRLGVAGGAEPAAGVECGARLRRLANEADRRRADPAHHAAATDSAAAAPVSPPAVASGAAIETPHQARSALGALKKDLLQIAAVLVRADGRDPLPYRLSRVLLWGDAARLQADPQGRLAIPGPEPAHAPRILERLRAPAGVEGLCSIEQAVQSNPFWLDLQHLSWLQLSSLGSEYSRAAHAIQRELAVLAEQQSSLPVWKFRSGLPLASAATRAWIDRTICSARTAAPSDDSPGDPDRADLEAEDARARALAEGGDVPGGLRLLAATINACGDGQRRFHRRLRLARLAIAFAAPEIALAQLEVLREDMARFNLEQWDPALCAEVLTEQLRALHGLGTADGQFAVQAAECRRGLARLVPASALQLAHERR